MPANPPFTDEHETLRESVRRFVANELRPHASEWEEARWFPNEVFGALARVGFLGLKYPEEYGGEGGDYLHDAVFAEEMARCGSGGVAARGGAPPPPPRAPPGEGCPRLGPGGQPVSARTSASRPRRCGSSAPRIRSAATWRRPSRERRS